MGSNFDRYTPLRWNLEKRSSPSEESGENEEKRWTGEVRPKVLVRELSKQSSRKHTTYSCTYCVCFV
jgi:hypothetical protein